MKVTCDMCGWSGDVPRKDIYHAPILAFYSRRQRHRYQVNVWICDVCISEVRNHLDSKLNSLETTDQTESEKRNDHI